MSNRYPQGDNEFSHRDRRGPRAYSTESRRPVSRQAREGRASDERAARRAAAADAQRYSLDSRSRESEYNRYSRSTVAPQHSARTKAREFEPRDGHYAESARTRRKGKRLRTIILAALAVILVAGVAVAGGFLAKINGNLNAGIDSKLASLLSGSSVTGGPSYFLLQGTDESKARAKKAEYGGAFRADTIILARVDPISKKVALVSIPRDTKVDLGGENGTQKINAASAIGGASMSVEAVENLTGVNVDHYVQVDFDGFADIVDALGGIEVKVPREINDPKAGGHLSKGKQTLNGKQALILCRSRHTYDDVGAGDKYRAANQRLVLTAIAKKLLSSDAATMAAAVDAMSQCVTTDISGTDIAALAQAFQGFDASKDMYTAEFPTDSSYEDDTWYEVARWDEWQAMLDRMNRGESPAESDQVDEATGTVMATAGGGSASSDGAYSGALAIRNGTTREGLADKAAEAVKGLGLTTNTGNAGTQDYTQTVVVYDKTSDAAAAKAVAQKLGVGTVMQNDGSYSFTGDILLVLGTDYTG